MKLRFRVNSIRLRLLRSEIDKLRGGDGFISEKIQFGASETLTYTLKISKAANEISARFERNEIVVKIPKDAARDWIETNLVGLESEQQIDENTRLQITIEKDFVCPDRPADADNADAFPNPKTNC